MYPHTNARMGERRAPAALPPHQHQHLLLQQQQPPGVIMSMPNHPVQILQNQHNHGHYSNQNTYQQSQGNSYVQQQAPPSYHQQGPIYPNSNTQTVNHKNYRKDYNVFKDSGYATGNKDDFSNSDGSYTNYTNSSYNSRKGVKSGSEPLISQSNMADSENEESSKKTVSCDEQTEESEIPDSTTEEDHANNAANILAGVKEKTPMCLVNELARFNKITHQYKLTDEHGPAHKKSFTVMLTLGHEEYTAEGPSIKKAQHAAAADALTKTTYPHPSPKTNRHPTLGKPNMTPTVELNALAMKRGEPTIYKLIDPPHPPMIFQAQQSYTFRRPYGIRGGFYRRGRANSFLRGGARMPFRMAYTPNIHYKVSLKVGDIEFMGEGNSLQAARHDAASKALNHLRLLPMPENCPAPDSTGETLDSDLDSSIKSPISLVHETALKRNLNVIFKVVSEKGPPHMKTFVTECIVGDMKAVGEGNGKKISKKRAAESMLTELKKLPPLSPTIAASINSNRLKRKPAQTKKKTRNLIKITQETKAEPETETEINPISRLIQIQQLKKAKEPVYTLLEEKGAHRRREFVIEVAIGSLTAVGSGPNKKIAKRFAAQNLLAQIEGTSISQENNSINNINKTKTEHQKTCTYSKQQKDSSGEMKRTTSGSGGRQIAPGIVYVNQTPSGTTDKSSEAAAPTKKSGDSSIPDSTASTTSSNKPNVLRPKGQLLYLASILHFDVQFSDYPKANHSEYLSLVSLSTNPPQVCHGSGATVEESQDQAASTALRALSEMGLDSVSSKEPSGQSKKSEEGFSGDDNASKNR